MEPKCVRAAALKVLYYPVLARGYQKMGYFKWKLSLFCSIKPILRVPFTDDKEEDPLSQDEQDGSWQFGEHLKEKLTEYNSRSTSTRTYINKTLLVYLSAVSKVLFFFFLLCILVVVVLWLHMTYTHQGTHTADTHSHLPSGKFL